VGRHLAQIDQIEASLKLVDSDVAKRTIDLIKDISDTNWDRRWIFILRHDD
jgi:hypothetical protein